MIVREVPGRPMPEIARDLTRDAARRAELIELATHGIAHVAEHDELAVLEAEHVRFTSLCMGMPGPTLCLMAAGLRWDDELRHPRKPGAVARVRLSDRVVFDGREMGIAEASSLVGGAIADWNSRGIVLGEVFGLRPPPVQEETAEPAPAQGGLF